MECSINKEALGVCATVFEGCSEQSIDLDFNLPDYCPDIQRILKCQVYPKITSRNIVADRLNVEGIYTVSLMYVDSERKSVRYCEHSSPFSAFFNLNSTLTDVTTTTKAKVEYINCRAISPRRLDIHGAFSVCAKVKQKEDKNIACSVSGDYIEQKKVSVPVSSLIGIGQQQFTVNETIELEPDLPPIESIIRSTVVILVDNYRTITNKLIVNATANLTIFYISDIESGKTNTTQYSVPISQIIDIDGIEDDCKCDISIEVLNHDLGIRMDGSGNGSLLSLEIKVAISATAYTEKEVEVLSDAYSTEYEIEPTYENSDLQNFYERLDIEHSEKTVIEINVQKISEILDVWDEMPSVTATLDGDNIAFKGKVNICVLALNEDDEPIYSERVVEFSHIHPWENKPKNISIEADIVVSSIDYTIINDRSIEITIAVKINATIFTKDGFRSISGISMDEEKPILKDSSAALTIYYTNKGENLWDIARNYNTSVEAIKLENELETETFDTRQMILIPM